MKYSHLYNHHLYFHCCDHSNHIHKLFSNVFILKLIRPEKIINYRTTMTTYNDDDGGDDGNEKITDNNSNKNGLSLSSENNHTVKSSKCDKMTKIPWKFLLISLVILFCALLINYHDEIFKVQSKNDQKKQIPITTTIKSGIKKQKHSHTRSATKKSIQDDHHHYDPDSMIRFIDNILNSTLDDFITSENITVNLTELSRFNNNHFAPRILSLVKLDPFKFVKFNLKRPCLLWPDTFSCTKM